MSQPGELSPLDLEIASSLAEIQPNYRFDQVDNSYSLSTKTFVATIGPTGTGKSTLGREVIRLDPDFKPNGTTTTRARRPGGQDPDNYITADEGVTHTSFLEDFNNGEFVNFTVFDTGHLYGTKPEDINEFAIGEITSDNIENLWNAGFKAFHPFFVVARGAIYKRRLEQERLQFPDIRKRLIEGKASLDFARDHVEATWLNFVDTGDTPESLEAAARTVIRTVHHNTHPIMSDSHKLQLIDEMEEARQSVASQLGLK